MSRLKPEETCAHCRFGSFKDDAKQGRCRKNPPVALYAPDSPVETIVVGWPRVGAKDWCGDFYGAYGHDDA